MTDGSKQPFASSTYHLVAGIVSGFASSILLQPFDLLKTRVQQQASTSSSQTSTIPKQIASRSEPSPIVRALKTIWAQPRPLQQLWRGTLPSVIRTSFGSGLYFAGLDRMRRTLAQIEARRGGYDSGTATTKLHATHATHTTSALPKLGLCNNLLTGALARASVGFIMMPITVLKVRFESSIYTSTSMLITPGTANTLNTSGNAYSSLWRASREIGRTEGLRGFFKGAGATVVRDAPYAGIYVGFYESAKTVLSPMLISSNRDDASGSSAALVNFSSGALAAALATTITNPPDIVKTRLQLMPEKYVNALQTARLMIKEEGLASMWDGLALRVGRKALSSALAWTVYEEAVRRATALWDTSATE